MLSAFRTGSTLAAIGVPLPRSTSARTWTPTVEDVAAYYRERNMAAVVFTVDAVTQTGRAAVPNEEIAEVAAANADVLIPFGSVDPHRPDAVDEVRRLIRDHGVRGFKFHPNIQGVLPERRRVLPDLRGDPGGRVFRRCSTRSYLGIYSDLPGGGGISRLKYSNPMYVDDVAVDFPD